MRYLAPYVLTIIVSAPIIWFALATSEPAKAGLFELNTVVCSIQNVEKVMLRVETILLRMEKKLK